MNEIFCIENNFDCSWQTIEYLIHDFYDPPFIYLAFGIMEIVVVTLIFKYIKYKILTL